MMGLSSSIKLAMNFEEDKCSGEEVCWKETAWGKHKNVFNFYNWKDLLAASACYPINPETEPLNSGHGHCVLWQKYLWQGLLLKPTWYNFTQGWPIFVNSYLVLRCKFCYIWSWEVFLYIDESWEWQLSWDFFFPPACFPMNWVTLNNTVKKNILKLGNVEIRFLDTILVHCPVSLCPWTSISFSAENCCSVLSSDLIFCFPTLNYVLVLFSAHCSSTVLNI